METFAFISVLCLGFTLASAANIPIHDCGSKLAKLNSIDITPCDQIPCPFKKGTDVNVTISFTTGEAVQEAASSVHGIIAGIPVPFPLKDKNACHDMNCPLAPGDRATYRNSVTVLKEYPEISVMVKWEIISAKADVICFTVPVKIVP